MADKIITIEDLRTVTKTGVIVRCREWSETEVHGGSAQQTSHIGPEGGSVTMPGVSISSTVRNRLHIFVRPDDGPEFDQTFVNPGVGVREGHTVSIVYVPDESGEPVALVNHDTAKSRVFEGRVKGLIAAPPAPAILRLLTGAYMLALIPLHIATYWLAFTGKLNHLDGVLGRGGGAVVEWILLNGLLIGIIALLPKLAPGVAAGLREEVIARIRRETEALIAVRPATAAT
jgi:hypothetical protein